MRSIRKNVKQDNQLVLIDIDDNTMLQPFINYSWPWPRFLFGDAVEVFAEFGVKGAVFDIEFLGRSVAGVSNDEVDNARLGIANAFQSIAGDFNSALQAVIHNPSFLKDTKPLVFGFENQLTQYYFEIDRYFNTMIQDNDAYFAKRLAYFGKAYGTVNMARVTGYSEDINSVKYQSELKNLQTFGINKDVLSGKKVDHSAIFKRDTAEFPEEMIVKEFKKVGFTSVIRDRDSYIRSIPLFMEKDGILIPQLSLSPLMDIYNIKSSDIDLSKRNKVIFKNVSIDGQSSDIVIPLHNGMMKINWPKGTFKDIFVSSTAIDGEKSHFSFARLIKYRNVLLRDFEVSLKDLSTINDEEFHSMYNSYTLIKEQKRVMIDSGIVLSDEDRKSMSEFMDMLLQKVIAVCSVERAKEMKDEIEKAGMSKEIDFSSIDTMLFNARTVAAEIIEQRAIIEQSLYDKICFIGLTATGTHDIGATPFDNKFANVGTHPSIFNTIINKQFIYTVPSWIIFIFSILFYMIVVLFLSEKDAISTALTGLVSIFSIYLLTMPSYRFWYIYISPVIPVLFGIITFISLLMVKFILSERDKKFIRSTFDRYLSPDVINDLIKGGKKIDLGGERRNCTAMFTDIESFSSFSEKFMDDPKGLVSLLNGYLSAMSDIIMDNGGTIDKYEGDAIIAFFGAPMQSEDHPFKACLASIRMKEAEQSLNKQFMDSGLIEKPIYTRIGINTGDMFVGNMGTYKRLEYTMIGHAVNLAARLEGVNKQYNTYQMISEFTYLKVANEILVRKLDSVRVVNINTPIRLYELIGLKSEVNQELKEAISLFDRAIELFDLRQYENALKIFSEIKVNPFFDKTTAVYIDRCKKFIASAPSSTWDGVYNLTIK